MNKNVLDGKLEIDHECYECQGKECVAKLEDISSY